MFLPTVGVLHPNLHPNPYPRAPHPITPTTPISTTTTSMFEAPAPLRPLAGHQDQRRVVSPTHKEAAPLNGVGVGFIAPTLALIQAPSDNRVTPRPAYCKMSTLWSPLCLSVLPLIYNPPWRCRAWFFAIDQDGDGTLSSEELRMYSLSDPFKVWLNYHTGSALLNNGGKIMFRSRHGKRGLRVPYLQACGSRPTR
jgi:hypothetical protein